MEKRTPSLSLSNALLRTAYLAILFVTLAGIYEFYSYELHTGNYVLES
jgi:hypothetical protein